MIKINFSAMTYQRFCVVLAEFIGTFFLVFFGCMAQVEIAFEPDALLKSLNFGFVVTMIIQMFGHISFAIINPAVTVAAVICGLISFPVIVCSIMYYI
jgi:aquaporin Z